MNLDDIEYSLHDFVQHIDRFDYALLHEKKVYFFENSSENKIHMPSINQSFGLSEGVNLEDYIQGMLVLNNSQIEKHTNYLAEAAIKNSNIQEGEFANYSAGPIIAFLYEDLFPFMCGNELGKHLSQNVSFDNIINEKKSELKKELDSVKEKFSKHISKKVFVSNMNKELDEIRKEYDKKLSPAEYLASSMEGTFLFWGGDRKKIVLDKKPNVSITLNGKTFDAHVNYYKFSKNKKPEDILDDIEELEEEIISKDQNPERNYIAYLATRIDDNLLTQYFQANKYSVIASKGQTDKELIGFEILKSGNVFVYYKLPAFKMKDPRDWLDSYYPYPDKDVGIELRYEGGQMKIVGNRVRGPTQHYAISAGSERLASMCNYKERPRKMFSDDTTWIASNLDIVAEMFTNGMTPNNVMEHGGKLDSLYFNMQGKMPKVISSSELKSDDIITNTHEWPANKWQPPK